MSMWKLDHLCPGPGGNFSFAIKVSSGEDTVTFQTVLASEPYTYVPTDGTAPVEANLAVVRRAE